MKSGQSHQWSGSGYLQESEILGFASGFYLRDKEVKLLFKLLEEYPCCIPDLVKKWSQDQSRMLIVMISGLD